MNKYVRTLFSKFFLRTAAALSGKKWFRSVIFYILPILEKEHLYCFTFSHGLSAEQNVRGLSFEKTTMPTQLNVSPVPGYRTAFWLHSTKGHQWVKHVLLLWVKDELPPFLATELLSPFKPFVPHCSFSKAITYFAQFFQILDFGLARMAEEEMTGYVATRWYRAPEIMLNWMHYNQTGYCTLLYWCYGFISLDLRQYVQMLLTWSCSPKTNTLEWVKNNTLWLYI